MGYQAQLALAECPPAVSQDAADLFAQLELLDFPVDYAVDLTLVPAEKARDQVRRKKNELIDQADQYDGGYAGRSNARWRQRWPDRDRRLLRRHGGFP